MSFRATAAYAAGLTRRGLSSAARKRSNVGAASSTSLFKTYPHLKKEVERVKWDVFGQLPQLNLPRTGHRQNKKQLKATYLATYYMDGIAKSARKVIKNYETEEEERRRRKLMQLRRRGKGPPKKGSSGRGKK